MRSYEHRVSKKQPIIFGRLFFIIVDDTNFCEALSVQQINMLPLHLLFEIFHSLHVIIKNKKRLRKLCNSPKF